ncbi:unnamed protein product, partial [Allacma fusca]
VAVHKVLCRCERQISNPRRSRSDESQLNLNLELYARRPNAEYSTVIQKIYIPRNF